MEYWIRWGLLALFLSLAGCSYLTAVDQFVDTARNRYCSDPTTRATVKANLSLRAQAEDYAIYIRCPGEEGLSGVGDPGTGLP